MAETQHIEDIAVQFQAWKLRLSDPSMTQEQAETQAIMIRAIRKRRG